MLPRDHAIAAGAAALPLARAGWTPLQLAFFFAGAVLIDGDHYLGYIWETGDLSLRRAYAFHRDRYGKSRRVRFRPHWPHLGIESSRTLHSAPAIALAFLVLWRWPALRALAWGLLFHRVQDELYGTFVS